MFKAPQWHLQLMATASLQGTALSALSNIIAQLIDPWLKSLPVTFHIVEFVRFVAVQALLQPPLFYWQMWMEANWPGTVLPSKGMEEYVAVPQDFELGDFARDSLESMASHRRSIASHRRVSGAAGEELESGNADVEAAEKTGPATTTSTKKGLVWRNVWIKWWLDNSLGALWFTVVFIVLLELFRLHGPVAVWHALLRDFIPLFLPSYILWAPASLFNFIWIPAEKRIVFLAFVGLCWNIYLSLFAAETAEVGSTSKKTSA
ncbi:hypothetical protein NA57DRAFT_70388 [Rhizodiscina lignyota]|uniref:Uncharacterized protein n=1 Tax=Rhizodiscina lignyota TaxID=1504668 RepID=A0A9P4ME69_9PEZI|nr:hypothetical protein NA57DRAFT_70388 [Rhizodiscina lignyota]